MHIRLLFLLLLLGGAAAQPCPVVTSPEGTLAPPPDRLRFEHLTAAGGLPGNAAACRPLGRMLDDL